MSQRKVAADLGAGVDGNDDTATGESLHDGGLSRRTMLFVLASTLFAVVCVLAALKIFVAEHIPLLTDAELERATKLWEKHGPASYDMNIELRGAQPGGVHIEVRNHVVMATTRNDRVPPQHTWETWTVPGMFDTLAQDLQIATDPEKEIQAAPGTKWQLRCEFDPENGIPRRYHRMVSGGPEVYWRVTSFQPK